MKLSTLFLSIPLILVPLLAYGVAQSLGRSEEHTSELQSRLHLVCRLLLEKKKIKILQKTAQLHINEKTHD